MAKAPQSSSAGLIIRQKEPTNLETPLDQVDSYITPTELFYIRSHFQAPRLELASYQLRVDGTVREPCSSAPGWKRMLARSCSRGPTGGRRQNSQSLPARFRMPGVCPGTKQFS